MRIAILAAAFSAMMLLARAEADDQADAKAVLDAAIAAKGGEAKLSKIVGTWVKASQTYYSGKEKSTVSIESFAQRDDRERTAFVDADNKAHQIIVFNGKEGRVKLGDLPATEMNGEQLAMRRDSAYKNWVTLLVPLEAGEFRLSTIDDASVLGRPAVGILVSHDKHDPVKLYFDKETHLLVKQKGKVKNPATSKEADMECVYSDFRNVDGMKAPFKAEMFLDGQKVGDSVIFERELYEKPLDEKLFSDP
jgi:hypothetical protein